MLRHSFERVIFVFTAVESGVNNALVTAQNLGFVVCRAAMCAPFAAAFTLAGKKAFCHINHHRFKAQKYSAFLSIPKYFQKSIL